VFDFKELGTSTGFIKAFFNVLENLPVDDYIVLKPNLEYAHSRLKDFFGNIDKSVLEEI
jgi:hypothetical protein